MYKIYKNIFRKVYDNFDFDYIFLTTESLTLKTKFAYILRKYYTLITRKNFIRFLDRKFLFDNQFTPVLLEVFPAQIDDLDNAIDLSGVKTVLDVGANIGQWAYTLKSLFPNTIIISLEPNKNIFKILSANSTQFKDWEAKNIGLGKKSHKFLYYIENKSSEATVYKDSSKVKSQKVSVSVKLITLSKNNISKYGFKKYYDLIKIDVEGAELEVLNSIRNIKFKYLVIEVAIERKGLTADDIKKYLKKRTNRKIRLLSVKKTNKFSSGGNAIFAVD